MLKKQGDACVVRTVRKNMNIYKKAKPHKSTRLHSTSKTHKKHAAATTETVMSNPTSTHVSAYKNMRSCVSLLRRNT